jgi:WD40 repeat protein
MREGIRRGVLTVWDAAAGKELHSIPYADIAYPTTVALGPDSKTTLTGNTDGSVRLWDLPSGKELLRSRIAGANVGIFAMSPDGGMVAAASQREGGVYLWERRRADKPRILGRLARGVQALAFSPDGKTLASGTQDLASLRLWDVASGRVVRMLRPDQGLRHILMDWVSGLVFSPDGKMLAASTDLSCKTAVILWDPATGRELRRLDTAWEGRGPLAFSADGRLVAEGVHSGVRVWHVESGKEVGAQAAGHRGSVGAIAFAPRGDMIATGGDDFTVRLWEARTGRQRLVLRHGHWVRAVAFTPDGKRLASSSFDDTVRLWDVATGREIYRLAGHGTSGMDRALRFSADGKTLASWGPDRYLRVWDVTTGKAVSEHRVLPPGLNLPGQDDEDNPRLEALGHMLAPGAFTPDGEALLQLGEKGLHLLAVRTAKELRAIPTAGPVYFAPVFSSSGLVLVSQGHTEHTFRLWHLPSGKMVRSFSIGEQGPGPRAFALSPDGKMIATTADEGIDLWEVATGGKRLTMPAGPPGWQLAFSPDGRLLVATMQDSTALVWDLARLRK